MVVENVSEWFSIFFLVYRCCQHNWDVNLTSLVVQQDADFSPTDSKKNMVDKTSLRDNLA